MKYDIELINRISRSDDEKYEKMMRELIESQYRLRARHKIYFVLIFIVAMILFGGISLFFKLMYKNKGMDIPIEAESCLYILPVLGAALSAFLTVNIRRKENNRKYMRENGSKMAEVGIIHNIKLLYEGMSKGYVELNSYVESDDAVKDMKDLSIKSFSDKGWKNLVISLPIEIHRGEQNKMFMYCDRIEAYFTEDIIKELERR